MPKASKASTKAKASSSLTEHAAAERRYTKASLEHFQRLGWGEDADWKGKPHMEAEGYAPVKRKVIKGVSEYDPARWGTPEFSARDLAVCMTKNVSKFFCLNNEEIVDLCFKKRIVITPNGEARFAHDYSCSELERRAWEKYGGPKGLEVERKKKAEQAARKKAGKTGANQDVAAQQVQIQSISSHRRYLETTEPMVYPTSEEHNVVPSVLRDDQPTRTYSDPRLAFSAFSNEELGYANEKNNKPNGSEDSVDNYDDHGCGADCDCRTCNAVARIFAGTARRSDRSYAPVVASPMQPPPLRKPPHKPQGTVVAHPGATTVWDLTTQGRTSAHSTPRYFSLRGRKALLLAMPSKSKPDPAAHAQRRYTQASFEHFQRLGMEGTIAWKGRPYIIEEGYPPVKRGKGSSEYDPAKWGPPEFPADDNTVCMKKDVAKIFCLNANDIVDLCYRKRPVKVNDQKEHIAHDYLASELERRAWEKYGGPEGLKIAREKRDKRVARTKATKQGRDKKDQANVQFEPTRYYKKDIPEPQSPEGDVRIISANDKPPMVLCVGKQPSPHSRGRDTASRGFSGNDLNNSESNSDTPDYYAEGGACDMKHAAFMGFVADLQSGRYGDEDELRRRREQQSAPGIQSTPIQSTQNQITSASTVASSGPPPTATSVSERKRRGVKRTRESESREGKDDVVPAPTTNQREVPAGQAAPAAAYSTPPTTPSRPSSKRRRPQSNRDKDNVDVGSGSSYPTPMSTSSKNKLPKTSKVRDLTRMRKERESQARQAATPSSESASPLAPSRRKPGQVSTVNAANGSKTLSAGRDSKFD